MIHNIEMSPFIFVSSPLVSLSHNSASAASCLIPTWCMTSSSNLESLCRQSDRFPVVFVRPRILFNAS